MTVYRWFQTLPPVRNPSSRRRRVCAGAGAHSCHGQPYLFWLGTPRNEAAFPPSRRVGLAGLATCAPASIPAEESSGHGRGPSEASVSPALHVPRGWSGLGILPTASLHRSPVGEPPRTRFRLHTDRLSPHAMTQGNCCAGLEGNMPLRTCRHRCEAEARRGACQSGDFRRAYRRVLPAKQKPEFEGIGH